MKEFERCLKERRLIKIQISDEMITKEIGSAEYDLHQAEESFLKGDFKWSSIQAYYSMFHAVRALILRKGYREKSHYCLLVALRELYVKTEEVDSEFADNFEVSMNFRKEADYASI
ncbi:MAG: HEPN domain-containing protein [Theionarchaea archaeon]|nr:HEPN domain-containing protein [Theionarchaea archaeon]